MTIKAAASALARRIREAGSWLFSYEDDFARSHGWTVEERHGGLGRTYRDPRFNHLAQCPACAGIGTFPDDMLCTRCAGSGRITLRHGTHMSAR